MVLGSLNISPGEYLTDQQARLERPAGGTFQLPAAKNREEYCRLGNTARESSRSLSQ